MDVHPLILSVIFHLPEGILLEAFAMGLVYEEIKPLVR
jgi:hypothetical protein